jgi:hypothetical protein
MQPGPVRVTDAKKVLSDAIAFRKGVELIDEAGRRLEGAGSGGFVRVELQRRRPWRPSGRGEEGLRVPMPFGGTPQSWVSPSWSAPRPRQAARGPAGGGVSTGRRGGRASRLRGSPGGQGMTHHSPIWEPVPFIEFPNDRRVRRGIGWGDGTLCRPAAMDRTSRVRGDGPGVRRGPDGHGADAPGGIIEVDPDSGSLGGQVSGDRPSRASGRELTGPAPRSST